VLNHVLLHQTVIGQETIAQLEIAEADWPDIVIGCTGGGSNFAGFAFPFVRENIRSGKKARIVAVEPAAAPSLTRGLYAYDFGDTAQLTPLLKMFTLGHDFVPAPIHAGGLRYHGMAGQISALKDAGMIEAVNTLQQPIFDAAVSFTRAEGILPAPETAHAVWSVQEEALACKASGEAKTIVFNLSGHGHFDLSAYQAYLGGDMLDYEYPEEQIRESLSRLPKVGA
jgi:tryptophan synthase beta chain